MKKNNISGRRKRILGGAIGNCVHVAGVFQYLNIAEYVGYETKFLGAAVLPEKFVQSIEEFDPGIVSISYRLTPSGLYDILERFFKIIKDKSLAADRVFYFGGTPECVKVAKKFKYFSQFFIGEEKLYKIYNTLQSQQELPDLFKGIHERLVVEGPEVSAKHIRDIIEQGNYTPMLRHHFGLLSLQETIDGIRKIAKAEILDVISLAPDQNAQEFFFEQEKMNHALDGTGGVIVRSEEDLHRIWEASQTGNYPRLRIYAGTRNLMQWAEMSVRLIHNTWGTIPLFWYSELDGRSKRKLSDAIRENQQTIKWYAQNNIPVEINDAHQWGLRECSDITSVVDFYIAAYNAKKLGVKKYIAQFMFNTPRLTSARADLAKMLAQIELIDDLVDENFVYFKQVRAGLTHFSVDMDVAKGQLAASTLLALNIKPQIIHVVSFTEANHAASADDVIESCKIVKGVLRNCWNDFPDLAVDPKVQEHKKYLVTEARKVLMKMIDIYQDLSDDPLSDPVCLEKLVKSGFLDAPHLKGNPAALGKVKTIPIEGGYEIVDENGNSVKMSDYISHLIAEKVKE